MTGRILIVDGVAANRIVLKVQLRDAFYDVVQADTTEAAHSAAKRFSPDVILLGQDMAGPEGLAFCRSLKGRDRIGAPAGKLR